MKPKLIEVRNGWAAVDDYWVVFGSTKEDAIIKFREVEQKHREISNQEPLLTTGDNMICLALQQAINCEFVKNVTYLIDPSDQASDTDYVVGFDSDEMGMTMVLNFCPFCGEGFRASKPNCYTGHVEMETQDREVVD